MFEENTMFKSKNMPRVFITVLGFWSLCNVAIATPASDAVAQYDAQVKAAGAMPPQERIRFYEIWRDALSEFVDLKHLDAADNEVLLRLVTLFNALGDFSKSVEIYGQLISSADSDEMRLRWNRERLEARNYLSVFSKSAADSRRVAADGLLLLQSGTAQGDVGEVPSPQSAFNGAYAGRIGFEAALRAGDGELAVRSGEALLQIANHEWGRVALASVYPTGTAELLRNVFRASLLLPDTSAQLQTAEKVQSLGLSRADCWSIALEASSGPSRANAAAFSKAFYNLPATAAGRSREQLQFARVMVATAEFKEAEGVLLSLVELRDSSPPLEPAGTETPASLRHEILHLMGVCLNGLHDTDGAAHYAQLAREEDAARAKKTDH